LGLVNELLTALAEVAAVEQSIGDWLDVPDPVSEYRFALAVASPGSAWRIRAAVDEIAGAAGRLGDLVAGLDAIALLFARDGDAETCGALLDLSGTIRDWADRSQR
jgi:hypothetical protein